MSQQQSKPTNKFGLNVDPPPDPNAPGEQAFRTKVTMEPRDVIPAHSHRSETPEVYVWVSGGTLSLFLQPPEGGEWEQTYLNKHNKFVGIPPYWRHGGLVLGKEPLEFDAYSRVDHFRDNTHQLPDSEQPKHILFFMQRPKGVGKKAGGK